MRRIAIRLVLPILLLACRPAVEATFPCDAVVDARMPTVVHVRWTADADEAYHVEYGVGDGYDLRTPAEAGGPGDRTVLLLGLPASSEVAIRAVVESEGETRTCEASLETGGFPSNAPRVASMGWDREQTAGFRWLLAALHGNDAGVLLIDREARQVWLHELPFGEATSDVQLARRGGGLLYNVAAVDRGLDIGKIVHVGFDGRVIESLRTPMAHHVFAQTEQGGLAWLVADDREWFDDELQRNIRVVGDAVVELRPEETVPETLWSTWDELEVEKTRGWDSGFYLHGRDWTHANGISAAGGGSSWMLSFANLDEVLEIDRMSRRIVRRFGTEAGYAFTEGSIRFYHTHGAHLTDEGTLLALVTDEGRDESIAVEWAVDHERRRLHTIWSYGTGAHIRAFALGQALRLDNGNTLVNFGSAGVIREVTSAGEVVWEIVTRPGSWFAQVQPLDDLYAFHEPLP